MPLSWIDLSTPMTSDEVKASIYGVMAAVGVNTTAWKPGAVVRTIVTGVSIVIAGCTVLISDIAKSGFRETAQGLWLRQLAKSVYGVDYQPATFATGYVTLVNSGGGVFDVDPEDLIVANPTTHKTYRNTNAFHLGAHGTITIPIQATEVGAASSSNANTITSFETPLIAVTCTNAFPVVGVDDQSDDDLRAACAEALPTSAPTGPRDAYAYWAKRAFRPDGSRVAINRVYVAPSNSYGNVTVIVATPTGTVAGSVNDPSTDLGIVAGVLTNNVLPNGVSLTLQSASPVAIPVSYSLWVQGSTLSDVDISTTVSAKLAAFMASQPIGGRAIVDGGARYVYRDAIAAAIAGAVQGVYHVEVAGADIAMLATGAAMLGNVVQTAVTRIA